MEKTKKLTHLALFTAIIMMLGLTPLGYIVFFAAGITTVHIPVIIGSYVFGVKESCYLGFIFGITSFIRCFTTPDAISAIVLGTGTGFGIYNLFLIIAIIFLPRILVGLFTNLSFKALDKIIKKPTIAMAISAFIGSMTNTIFVLGGLFVFAQSQAAVGFGMAGASASALFMVIMGVVAINGSLEAIFAVIISTPVGMVLKKFAK
ncbi:MAG: ECF transporter S component [Clostridia bacterium]